MHRYLVIFEKNSDSYIYDITAEPTKLFPLYYTNFSGSVILPDGQAWNGLLRPSGEFLSEGVVVPYLREVQAAGIAMAKFQVLRAAVPT